MKDTGKGGDAADQEKFTSNNTTTQELAFADPSAVVHVEVVVHGEKRHSFKLRCGLTNEEGVS